MTQIKANQLEIEEILNDPLAFADETKAGTVELATQAEVDSGAAGHLVATAATVFGRPSDILDMTAFSDGTTDSISSTKDTFSFGSAATGLSIDTLSAVETGFNTAGMATQINEISLNGLGTPPWPVATSGAGAQIKPDGTEIWFACPQELYIYTATLATPFDISTMGTVTTIAVPAGNGIINIDISPDGFTLFLGRAAGIIDEFALSPAWDVTSLTLTNTSSIFSPGGDNDGVYWSRDGLRGYAGDKNEIVYSFTLSSAWDITTASVDAFELDISAHASGGSNQYASVNEDGTKLYYHRFASPMHIWTMSVPYELSSATWDSDQSFSASSPRMGSWSDGGLHYYVTTDDYLYQWDTGFGDGGSGATSTSLYYDGTATLTTSTDGVEVTGIVSFVAEGSPATTPQIVLPNYATVDLPATILEGGTVYDSTLKTLTFYNGSVWTRIATGTPASAINELTDVTIAGSPGLALASGQVLKYDGSGWINDTNANPLGDLTVVSIPASDTIVSTKDIFALNINSVTGLAVNASAAAEDSGYDLAGIGLVLTTDTYDKAPDNVSVTAGIADHDNGDYLWWIENATSDPRTIFQRTMATPYDVTTAGSAVAKTFNLGSANVGSANIVRFSTNGMKMFISAIYSGYSGRGIVEYSLSSAYDISTASYTAVSIDLFQTGDDIFSHEPYISNDGFHLYAGVKQGSSVRAVHEYVFGTAWDVTTLTFVATLDVTANNTYNRDVSPSISKDGTKFFTGQIDSDGVTTHYNTYTLSPAYDLSSASWVSLFSLPGEFEDTGWRTYNWDSTGTRFYTIGDDTFYQWDTAAGDGGVGTTYSSMYYDGVSVFETVSDGVQVSNTLHLEGVSSGRIVTSNELFEINVNGSVGADIEEIPDFGFDAASITFTTDTASYAPINGTAVGTTFIRKDGLAMYITDSTADPGTVREYTMSTAWDITTKSGTESASFVMSSGDHAADTDGIWFNDDGTKAIVSGATQWAEYSFSPGYDLTSATFVQVVSAFNENTGGSALSFSQDGTKAFRMRRAYSQSRWYLASYNVGTPFDVSTISSITEAEEITSETGGNQPYGVTVNNDGTKLFVVHDNTGEVSGSSKVREYTLSTPYDTTSRTLVASQVVTQSRYMRYIHWNTNGTELIMMDNNATVYKYTSSAVSIGGLTTRLHHNGTVRLTTQSTGVQVNGNLEFTGSNAQLALPNYATLSLPSVTVEGGTVYDSDVKVVKFHDGISWKPVGPVVLDDLTDVVLTGSPLPATNDLLKYNGANWVQDSLNIIEDTTPQLGGDLDVNGNAIRQADNDSGTPTQLSIGGGNSITSNGGSVSMFAGDSSTGASGGDLSIGGGSAYGTGHNGGWTRIWGAYSFSGNGGHVSIKGGFAYNNDDTGGDAGNIFLACEDGYGTTGLGGDIIIESGRSTGGPGLTGGDIKLLAKNGYTEGGSIQLECYGTWNGLAGEIGGDITLEAGWAGAGSGGSVRLTPGHGDANGNGRVVIHAPGSKVGVGRLDFRNDTNTSHTTGNTITLEASSSLVTDVTLILPVNDGDSGQVLSTNGSGLMSWVPQTAVGMSALVDDTDPHLGGNLITGGQYIMTDDVSTNASPDWISIKSGAATYAGGGKNSGQIQLRGGQGTNNNGGGRILIVPGAAVGTGNAGNFDIIGGNSVSGSASDITFTAGTTTDNAGTTGDIVLTAGGALTSTATGGKISLIAGGSSGGTGGDLVLTAGGSSVASPGGDIEISPGVQQHGHFLFHQMMVIVDKYYKPMVQVLRHGKIIQ